MAKTMNKEFVTYEQALALKELGFDEPCLAGYDLNKSMYVSYVSIEDSQYYSSFELKAPLKQQVFRWFREKHNLLGYVDSDTQEYGIEYSYHINDLIKGHTHFQLYIDSYEQAEQACIDELIKLSKQQDNG